ncbi:heparan-alpha-glucosaminide N-acetyltransferase domain-containing protein [Glaciihabitans sp. dw_435]|uniref:heparan-alpha-glucosaminide N-acetyltransferase domain-containing protein n=1 Tax=Glaciihabitans sp. dw_435 TaxID=2720081 RepID=UPI001BD1DA23|nr:heparan-alpha-glucosaminide N-acetyltransferase domain-containing protein [Glaciihabitans sp. dw_435]
MAALPAVAATPRRTRSLFGSDRIAGLDLARGLAIIGMFAAHTLLTDEFDWVDASTWVDLVNGRSAVLFATLAGISIAIITGGRTPVDGVPLVQARVRILVRAALLFVLGGVLTALGTNVYVILEYYAVMFVLALPLVRVRPRRLFVLAGVLAVVMPVVRYMGASALSLSGGQPSEIGDLTLTGIYPALVWIAFVVAGLAIGRLDLASRLTQLRLLVVGTGISVLGYGAGALLVTAVGRFDVPQGGAYAEDWAGLLDLRSFATIAPHSGSPFEVVGAAGFAMAVIGLCLLIARPLRYILFPVAATGAMALTAYSGQLVALSLLGRDYWTQGSNNAAIFWWLTVGTLVFCSVWTLLLGRGPLERVLTSVSRRAAAIVARPSGFAQPTASIGDEPERSDRAGSIGVTHSGWRNT